MSLPTPYYEKDGITIYHADCRDILPHLPKVDLVLTDPPYGMNKEIANDGADFLDIVGPALQSAFRLTKPGASMFVFTAPGQVLNVGNAVGQPLRRLMWMYKPADICFPYYGWLQKSEAILWFSNGKPVLEERHPFSHDCYTVTRQTSIDGKGHPTVKPWQPIADIVSRCPKGGTVLDPFLGSGTTLKAAKFHSRRAIGIEIEEKYCEIAVKRLAQGVLGI